MQNNLEHHARIVAYVRDSGGKDQELSTEQQRVAIGNWCKDHDLILTRVFEDAARSGTKTTSRDSFLEMIDYLRGKPQEKVLVIWEYARLSRDYDDLMYFIADLRRRGITVTSVMDHIPEGPIGKVVESLIAWKNEQFIEDLRRSVKRGMRYVVEVYGVVPGTRCPVGYKFEHINIRDENNSRTDKPRLLPRLVIDPEKAPLVRRAFKMRAEGATYKEIHVALHLSDWLSMYRYILHNRTYTGDLEYDGKIYPNFCEPIIDKETWDLVQKINNERTSRYSYNKPRSLRSPHLLSGIIYCAKCGSSMVSTSLMVKKKKSYRYYQCQTMFNNISCGTGGARHDVIEKRVLDILRERILQPDVLEDIYQQAQQEVDELNKNRDIEISHFGIMLKENNSQIGNLVSAIAEMGHSSEMLRKLKELEDRQADVTSHIDQLKRSIDPLPPVDFSAIVAAARSSLDIATPEETRDILRGFINRIEVHARNGDIKGKIYYTVPGLDIENVIDL